VQEVIGDDFAQANQLWVREGRTGRALELYRQAQQHNPDDPVVAFQYARALWAVGRLAEAAALLTISDAHRNELSQAGAMLLDRWQHRVRQPPPSAPDDPPVTWLDRDVLERQPDPDRDWRDLAELAAGREMPGLASWALERWNGVPLDADDMDDLARIQRAASHTERALREMYRRDPS
jgi:tetratricopeptide (TPR) repeat protein